MPRRRPPDRFEHLVGAGIRAFVAHGGFERTSIVDVARELGVAKGTVYLYVQSKEALFDLCLRLADREGPIAEPAALPVPTPEHGATLTYVRELLDQSGIFAPLDAMLSSEPELPVREELTALIDTLYDLLASHRVAIRLINASARDLPPLSEVWFETARGGLNRRLAAYLSRRSMQGHLRPMPDPTSAARLFTEMVFWFAVSRAFDPVPDGVDDLFARATVKTSLLRTFLPAEHSP